MSARALTPLPLPFPLPPRFRSCVGRDELDRLDEHPGGAAAGVVDPAPVGLEHLDQHLDHAPRGVELAPLLALGVRELGEEVLVDTPEHVLRAGLLVAHPDVADHVDELAEAGLVEGRPGVVLGEHPLERGVVPLDGGHGVVHELADGGLPGLVFEVLPAGLGRYPEDVLGPVLVRILRVCPLVDLGFEPRVGLFEGVRDVLEKDQPQDHVLVLRGVHRAAKGVRHLPELGLVADVSGGRAQ